MAWWLGLSCMDACISKQALSARANQTDTVPGPRDTYLCSEVSLLFVQLESFVQPSLANIAANAPDDREESHSKKLPLPMHCWVVYEWV